MSFIPGLGDDAHLLHVLARFPKGLRPLLELHDAILRETSELTVGQRELIAAFVSGTNACRFCYGAHELFAEQFGIEAGLMGSIMEDFDAAPIDAPLRALLRYVKKLTRAPATMTQADADAVFAAGWSEDALFDAVLVCALFNYMNRIVEGTGIKPMSRDVRAALPAPARRESYVELLDSIDRFSD
jgi:uncharacterized peroxidase-related enzyme